VHDLSALLGPTRIASEAVLAREASSRSLQRWLASGRLVRVHPGWVTLPEWLTDWTVRAHAATSYTGGVLSHTSALTAHGLVDRPGFRLDVTVPLHHRLRSGRRLRIHRSPRPGGLNLTGGLAATTVSRALVDTWGDAHRGRQSDRYITLARDSVLRATRERRVAVTDVEAELPAVPHLPGLTSLRELLANVRDGSHSHLEIIGLRALRAAGLPAPHLQYEIALGYGTLHVDAAWPEVELAVEFDGASYHANPDDWQRDLRRDAALAALGWLVLRFSYVDMTERPAFCAAQVAAAYRERRRDVPPPAISRSGTAVPGTS
jgi:very-short-patch-repair endonuclease